MTEGRAEDTAPAARAPTVREQLIDGTLRYLDEVGQADLTVRALATASGRSTMCVYSKFGSRAKLLAAVFDRAQADVLVELHEAADLDEFARRYLRSAREHPGRYALLFETDLAALGLDGAERHTAIDAVVAQIEALAPATRSAASVWAVLHGSVSLVRAGHEPPAFDLTATR